jgi:hypothetical protein
VRSSAGHLYEGLAVDQLGVERSAAIRLMLESGYPVSSP